MDILHLSNFSEFQEFNKSLKNLKSKFLEIQLSEDFSNFPLYQKLYEALKSEKRSLLLNIPAGFPLRDVDIRCTDAVFLTYERNGKELSSLVDYCTEKNIRVCLRISKDKDIGFAYQLQAIYPNVLIILRMDTLNFQKAFKFFNKTALYLDLPLCISMKYGLQTSLKALFDVSSFLDDSGYYPADVSLFLDTYRKKKNPCASCESGALCFGFPPSNTSLSSELSALGPQKNRNILYPTVVNRLQRLKPLDCKIILFDPEEWETSGPLAIKAINQMQKTRLEKRFSGSNFYYIWDVQKSFYFNRPLVETNLFERDPRGLISLNWQFIGIDNPEMLWKQKCDLLLPEHGFVVTSQVSFDKHWSKESQQELNDFTLHALKTLIVESGVPGEKVQQIGNDLLYEGKKFCGKEWIFAPGYGYIENTVITCEYLPEEEWFKKLYHHKGEYTITGITEEAPQCTKKYLIQGLYQKLASFVRGF